ncbi:serine/threonine-protein kinase [Streptomyces broussonetiae]|uniref:non-specific serine/threonine protein kinase n=1 Tax=Streptomyces broussonetiae TaxID=2686304 RepID=A0ABV5E3Q8_9ACTN
MTGRYRLVESIGQGGMGRVWRAVDEILDRPVAVKEMRIDGLDAEDERTRRERALREARATARIDHPNVVRVYDAVDEGERLWIVMELVRGRSLERIMAEDGPLTPAEAARTGLGLVAALREVHARGVLHRDIKPGNVLIEYGGQRGRQEGPGSSGPRGPRVVLTDFGIAAIQDAKALTMVGMLVGSPDYMAPERVTGRPQGPPSDVWSVGATLCAALAGRSPFARDTTLATLHAVLHDEPDLPATAGPLHDLLAALLAKDPATRPDLDGVEAVLHPVAYPVRTPTVLAEPQMLAELQMLAEPRVPAEPPGAGAAGPPSPPTPLPPPPVGEPPGPPRPTPRPSPAPSPALSPGPRRRRTAVLTAAAVAVTGALVAVVLTATSGTPDDDRGADGAGGSEGPRTSVTPSPTVEGTARPRSLPPGTREEAGGFAWAPPDGWQRDVKTGSEVHYTSPDGTQELVAKSSLARGDLMDTWETSERNARQGQDYLKIRLEETTFRGHPAVVWEYRFTLKGVSWHARLLGFDTKGRSYQISTWYQPHVEERAVPRYEEVKDSFMVL